MRVPPEPRAFRPSLARTDPCGFDSIFLAFILCRSVLTSSYDNGVYNKMYLLDARPRRRGEQLAASLSNNYAMSKGTRCKVLACFSVKT